MKLSRLTIGKTFWMSGKKYLCTDIGKRNVLAVHLNLGARIPMIRSTMVGKRWVKKQVMVVCDAKYFNMPPECLHQIIIYRCEFDACQATKTKFQAELEEKLWKRPRSLSHDRTLVRVLGVDRANPKAVFRILDRVRDRKIAHTGDRIERITRRRPSLVK